MLLAIMGGHLRLDGSLWTHGSEPDNPPLDFHILAFRAWDVPHKTIRVKGGAMCVLWLLLGFLFWGLGLVF